MFWPGAVLLACPEQFLQVFSLFWPGFYLQVRLGWRTLQLSEADSLFPQLPAWDVSPDCSKVTSSTRFCHHTSPLTITPPSRSPAPLPFRLFSCLSAAVTGSSSFAPLTSRRLTSPSSLRRLLSPALCCCCCSRFLIKTLSLCWTVGVRINSYRIISVHVDVGTIAAESKWTLAAEEQCF